MRCGQAFGLVRHGPHAPRPARPTACSHQQLRSGCFVSSASNRQTARGGGGMQQTSVKIRDLTRVLDREPDSSHAARMGAPPAPLHAVGTRHSLDVTNPQICQEILVRFLDEHHSSRICSFARGNVLRCELCVSIPPC